MSSQATPLWRLLASAFAGFHVRGITQLSANGRLQTRLRVFGHRDQKIKVSFWRAGWQHDAPRIEVVSRSDQILKGHIDANHRVRSVDAGITELILR